MAHLSTRDLMAQAADSAPMQPLEQGAHPQGQHQEPQIVSLDSIKRQLSGPAQTVPIHGYLLKRSENLRIWNQRWFSLDPVTGKMEYRLGRTDPYPRGSILFFADSTITVSPINFHGAKQYDGCCFYIGTAGKKEYFLAAETPAAARAWVNTLRASALVLKAHREAMEAEGGAPSKASLKALAAATAHARNVAKEASKDIADANQKAVTASTAAAASGLQSAGFMGPSFFSSFLPSPAPAHPQPPSPALATAPVPPAHSSSIDTTSRSLGSSGNSSASGSDAGPSRLEGAAGLQHLHGPASRSTGGTASGEEGPENNATIQALQVSLKEKDVEIAELKELMRLRDENLDSMRERLEEAAAAAEKAADAAQRLGQERDKIRIEATRLCADLESRFSASDAQVAAARAERDGALAALGEAKAEIARLRAALHGGGSGGGGSVATDAGSNASTPMLTPLSSSQSPGLTGWEFPEYSSGEAAVAAVAGAALAAHPLTPTIPPAPSNPQAPAQALLPSLAPVAAPPAAQASVPATANDLPGTGDLLSQLPTVPSGFSNSASTGRGGAGGDGAGLGDAEPAGTNPAVPDGTAAGPPNGGGVGISEGDAGPVLVSTAPAPAAPSTEAPAFALFPEGSSGAASASSAAASVLSSSGLILGENPAGSALVSSPHELATSVDTSAHGALNQPIGSEHKSASDAAASVPPSTTSGDHAPAASTLQEGHTPGLTDIAEPSNPAHSDPLVPDSQINETAGLPSNVQ